MTRQEELHLVALAQAGDRDAANRLVVQWTPYVRKLSNYYHRRCARISVEDFMQYGWMAFWRAVMHYKPEFKRRLPTYALTAARYAMHNEVRAAQVKKRREEYVGFDVDEEYRLDPVDHRSTEPCPGDVILLNLSVGRIYRILTPRQREAVRHLSDGKTSKEAAAVMGVSRQAVEHLRNGAATKILKSKILRSA